LTRWICCSRWAIVMGIYSLGGFFLLSLNQLFFERMAKNS
jgi:hypothetical protein